MDSMSRTSAWALHHFRTTCGVLLAPAGDSHYAPASFRVNLTPVRDFWGTPKSLGLRGRGHHGVGVSARQAAAQSGSGS